MRGVIAARCPGLNLPRGGIGRHAATLDLARHSLGENVHITVHGAAPHKVRHRLRRREHVAVGREAFESPSLGHGGGGGARDVGIVA